MVAAYLVGWPIAVPDDADVGGTFQRTPACRAADQTGCVVSFSTYRETAPPDAQAVFGRVAEGRALCNHPGALMGGAAVLRPYFDSVLPPQLAPLMRLPGPFADPEASAAVETRFWTVPDFVEAECVTDGEFSYMEIRLRPDPQDPRVDDIGGDLAAPGWGLHLVDVSLALGDLIALAESQIAAFGR
jgi:hypothetical protein